MRKLIVGVRDLASHSYHGICVEDSEYSACRSFTSSCLSCKAKKEGLLWTHGQDFELRVLAEIDVETGEVFPLPKGSEFLMDGSIYMMGIADDDESGDD